MIRVIGPKDPKNPAAVNTTSRSNTWSHELSPFALGPIPLYGYYVAKNMENAWQYAKVYAQHVGPDGLPNEHYWPWATAGWSSSRADRYPMGKGAKPEYSWWDGAKLTYVEARKKIYAPLYAGAVVKTAAFQKLKGMADEGDVVLWDFDGYDHRALGMTLRDVINDPMRKCGHAFVLAMLLEGVLEECLA